MPDIYLTAAELAAIRARLERPGVRFWLEALVEPEACAAMAWEGVIPAPCGNHADWVDPRHNVHLMPAADETDVLLSPVDGERFRGPARAAACRMLRHEALANGVRSLALHHALAGDAAAAGQAMAILDAYARVYEAAPVSGPEQIWLRGKMLPFGLIEATWSLSLLWGADLLRVTGAASPADWRRWRDGLFVPVAEFLRDQVEQIHNIRCWFNAVRGTIGLAFGIEAYVSEAVEAPWGWWDQLRRGQLADGTWGETSSLYQWYCLQALTIHAEAAIRAGQDFYADQRLANLALAGERYVLPDLTLAPLNDTGSRIKVSPMVLASTRTRFDHPALSGLAERRLALFREELPVHGDTWKLCRNGGRMIADLLLWEAGATPHGGRRTVKPWTAPPSQTGILRDDARGHAVYLEFGAKRLAHRHYERLSLALYLHGEPVLIDRGATAYHLPIYNFYRYTPGHNTVASTAWHHLYENDGYLLSQTASELVAEVEIHQGVTLRRTVRLAGDAVEDELVVSNRLADPVGEFDLYLHPAGQPLLDEALLQPAELAMPYFGYEGMRRPRRFKGAAPSAIRCRDGERALTIGLAELPAGAVLYVVETPGPGHDPSRPIQALIARCPAARELRYRLRYESARVDTPPGGQREAVLAAAG